MRSWEGEGRRERGRETHTEEKAGAAGGGERQREEKRRREEEKERKWPLGGLLFLGSEGRVSGV